jgi:DNA-binding NtrC family response regulator
MGLGLLAEYSWPGNVRELKRAVERAVFVASDRLVVREDVEDAVAALMVPKSGDGRDRRAAPRSLRDLEREHILAVLEETGGNAMAAAVILGLSRSQVYRRMQELGISRPRQR